MTRVYFVRHAESDIVVHDDVARPLTPAGISGSKKVTEFLKDKKISKALSSPFKRSVDTIIHFTEQYGLDIEIIDDLRERKISDRWISDFDSFTEKQWSDFSYKLDNGECLAMVQKRNVNALKEILIKYPDETIVIGTHGTSLSTILHYYNNDFCYKDFQRIRPMMPYIICLNFEDGRLVETIEYLI